MIGQYTTLILNTIAWLFLGLSAWISGNQTFREIFTDIGFMWSVRDDGSVYYGISFTDE